MEEVTAENMAESELAPKVVRVPRVPTRREREIHEALHIPHAEWCEFCVRGRARNKPHGQKKSSTNKRQDIDGSDEKEEEVDTNEAPELKGVPRVSMDYFFPGEIRSRVSPGKRYLR